MTRAAGHHCHARGCETSTAPRLFMCKPHWYRLPAAKRRAIWDTYRPGQELDKEPSRAYVAAARDAIEWLAAHELVEGGVTT